MDSTVKPVLTQRGREILSVVLFGLASFVTATLLAALVWLQAFIFYRYSPSIVGPILQSGVTVAAVMSWYVVITPKPGWSAYVGASSALAASLLASYYGGSSWRSGLAVAVITLVVVYVLLRWTKQWVPNRLGWRVLSGSILLVACIVAIYIGGYIFLNDLAP